MTNQELIAALRRNMTETGSLLCLGCGHEHNCSTQGCAIMREAAERIDAGQWIPVTERMPETFDDLTALAKAWDEGRVVVPPVSLSQKIYKQSPLKSGVVEYTVTRIILSRFGFDFEAVAFGGTETRFSGESIGKTVFLTRAEKKAVLKGAAEHENN